jgi:hypothetical protein
MGMGADWEEGRWVPKPGGVACPVDRGKSVTYMKVTLLRTKDKALQAYKAYANWAQTQHGAQVKRYNQIAGENTPVINLWSSYRIKELSIVSPHTTAHSIMELQNHSIGGF